LNEVNLAAKTGTPNILSGVIETNFRIPIKPARPATIPSTTLGKSVAVTTTSA
jgi:hypothetical protein